MTIKLKENKNSEIFLRPRFTLDLDGDSKTLLNLFSNEFNKSEVLIRGKITDEHIFISVPIKKEHFWSPQLHLEILDNKNNTIVKGLFGPKPQVWTMFMFVHFVVGISFLGFLVMFYSRITLNESIFFPVLMMIFLPLIWTLLYFLGKIGKDTGKKQMHELHDFMKKVIEEHQSL
jgi:Na+/melibiose symporter-like transporter